MSLLSNLSAQRLVSSPYAAQPMRRPSRLTPHERDHLAAPSPLDPRRSRRSRPVVPRAGFAEGLRHATYNAAVRTALGASYGMLSLASAATRRIYEPQLTPPGTVTVRNVDYLPPDIKPRDAQTLDILTPAGKHLPVVVYMHGGAFVNGSKDTHWMMPLPFLHMGCVVVNINYRLAPKHPFPAALEDACAAVQWVVDHIADHGGDPTRVILAGDSAGGNLATAVCACMCWPRPEPFAQALFARGIAPRAVLPHAATYSMLKFDDYVCATPQDQRAAALLAHINNYYLRAPGARSPDLTLANPLTLCHLGTPATRPLPPFFISAGSVDPLLEDSQLAAACLRGAGAEVETKFYEGGIHVFHALYFTPSRYLKIAVAHWMDTMRFLKRQGLVQRKD